MTTAATNSSAALTEEQIGRLLEQAAEGFATVDRYRAPVLHWPSEAGLDYDDVTFTSSDGVPLEGWFIPAAGSDRLIIANHPSGFSRSGQPTQLDPWNQQWGTSGNGFEVNFVPDLKILHDAGYNVLTYDLRNHGLSGAANGGIGTSGWLEARDVVGSLRYARGRADTAKMAIGLFSRCLGCNSTFAAMTQFPREFDGVRCLVAPQPVTTRIIVTHQLARAGIPSDRIYDAIYDLDRRIVLRTSFGFAARDPREWAKNVPIPTFLYQVHDDVLTEPGDIEAIFENIPVTDKKLQWVENTTARWDGYLEFQRRPQPMLEWFGTHMK
jgi:uncharacterized protein